MDACAGVDFWMVRDLRKVGDFKCLVHGGGAFAYAYGEDGVDSCGVGSEEDFFAVCRSFGIEVQVGVGVDERHCSGSRVQGKAVRCGVMRLGLVHEKYGSA